MLGVAVVICDALVLNPQQSNAIHGAAKVTAVIAFVGVVLALVAATFAMVTYATIDLAGFLRRTWRTVRRRP